MEPGTRRDSTRQFASAKSCGAILAFAASLLRVSLGWTIYAIHPGGVSQVAASVVWIAVDVVVGDIVAVNVTVLVGDAVVVDVGVGVTVFSISGVKMAILSRVG